MLVLVWRAMGSPTPMVNQTAHGREVTHTHVSQGLGGHPKVGAKSAQSRPKVGPRSAQALHGSRSPKVGQDRAKAGKIGPGG